MKEDKKLLRKQKIIVFLTVLIFAMSLCSPVFASTKYGGPWNKVFTGWFGDEAFSTSWTYNYRGNYYDVFGQPKQIVNNHYSGGCISPAPGTPLVANFLTYTINGSNTHVYFDTNPPALCQSPKRAYEFSKSNYNITWNPYEDTMTTTVTSHWHSNVTDPSDVYASGTVAW